MKTIVIVKTITGLTKRALSMEKEAKESARETLAARALKILGVIKYDKDCHTEDATVGGDERQIYPESLIECGRDLAQDNLDHLDKCSNDKNECYRLQISQPEGIEHEMLQCVGDHSRQGQHECYCHTHADSRLDLLRHTEERANAEELRQDDVVYKYCCDEY